MRRCTECGRNLSEANYYKRNREGDLRGDCKECHSQKVVAAKKIYRRSLRHDRKCERCGFDDPRALDFHHRDRTTKKQAICDMLSGGVSKKLIEAEIAKCDVLCANCHRIKECEVREIQRRTEADRRNE